MGTKSLNKAARLTRNDLIATGLQNHCSKGVLYVKGSTLKVSYVIDVFETASEAEKKAITSHAQYLADVAAARAAEKAAKALVTPVKTLVTGMFGKTSAITAEFGFGPAAAKTSLDTRVEAVEKTRATRIARGTKGSRQKAAIHGVVETSTPSASAPAAQSIAAPIVAPSNGTNGTTTATQPAALSLSQDGSNH